MHYCNLKLDTTVLFCLFKVY